jgi:glycerate 2-kinase
VLAHERGHARALDDLRGRLPDVTCVADGEDANPDPRRRGGAGVRVVIAPDKLAGTYTAAEAAAALERGWLGERPADEIATAPLADGGEGTAEALLAAAGGEWRTADVRDALGRRRRARFALLADRSAALDVAEACGRQTVSDVPPDPLGASSYGAGQLIAAAAAAGARRIVVGVGGTASTDGGAGLRDALGDGVAAVELVAALDVRNPLLGPDGAAAVFGPQKGASPEQVAALERRLAALHLPTAALPGAGAGGGVGAMLMALGARAVAGAELVAEAAGLGGLLAGAALCITAEGRIDRGTLGGKVVATVADRCARTGVRCIAVGGIVDREAAGELARRGCETYQCGDMERAGSALAARPWPQS